MLMAWQTGIVKVLEDSQVSPPPGSVQTTTVPLTFFDIYWINCCPVQFLFLFEMPYPTLHFTQTTVPNLKTSLFLALKHFFPLAGNIIFPSPPQQPYILYSKGDFVPFIVAESTADFSHLVGNHEGTVGELQALVRGLPRSPVAKGCKQQPAMAIQVTVFPNSGISIGVTFSHMVVDGRVFTHFMKSWAVICKSKSDLISLGESLPIYNKDLIRDTGGNASIFMKDASEWEDLSSIPLQKLRITAVINRSQIEILKNWVKRKSREESPLHPLRISTFIVTCAYMWVCLIKSQETEMDDSTDHNVSHFVFAADLCDRLKIPATYFGNCLEPLFAEAKRGELLGETGILAAAKAVGREIMELERGALRGAERWVLRAKEISQSGGHLVNVAGSPKLRWYELDFGWGRPKKTEVADIGSNGLISIAESRDEEGGIEFGLALSKDESERFNAAFKEGWLMLS
ncbi:hypothetical protein SLA2020_311690 [Shorea laevis]